MEQKLIFVYNANSGLFSSLTDTVHKMVSPSTYKCNLCAITYGALDMKQEWRKFIENFPHEVEFLHKNEMKKYPKFKKIELPAVLLKKRSKTEQLVKAEEINGCKTIKELKNLVNKKLEI